MLKPKRHISGDKQGKPKFFSYYGKEELSPQSSKNSVRDVRLGSKLTSEGILRVLKRIPGAIALLTIAGSILYMLSLTPIPKILIIKPVLPQVGYDRGEEEYFKFAQKILLSSYKNRSKITISTKSIQNKLKEQFPEIEAVNISLPMLRRRPVFVLRPSPLAALINSDGKTLALDYKGRVRAYGENLSHETYAVLPLIKDESGSISVFQLGQQALTSAEMEFISELYRQLAAQNIKVSDAILPAAPSEMHLRIEGAGYFIKFNLKADARLSVGSFLAVKAKLEADRLTPAEYIDVRVEEKAFYK